jgi:hypothetical protein
MCSRSHTIVIAPQPHSISSTLSRIGFTNDSHATSPPKRQRSSNNSPPTKLKSVLTGTLSRVAQFRQLRTKIKTDSEPFFGNKAAESCYWYIKETLNCEDTHQLAMVHENPPLPDFIFQILEAEKAPHSLVETVMLLVHRYHLLAKDELAQKESPVCGHLIFLCAYLTAAHIHFGPDSFGYFVHYCMEQSNYSENNLTNVQRLFQAKVNNLRPISLVEENTLFPFFQYFRVVGNVA